MIIADFLPAIPDHSWTLALQAGVTHALCKCAPELTGLAAPDHFEALCKIRDRFAAHGLSLIGLEGDEFDMQRIKLGRPGRDEDLCRYQQMLRNMGRLGIGLLCYNFMATIGWCRTQTHVRIRGGAMTNRFNAAELNTEAVAEQDRVSEAELWDNYRYFLARVLPVAEEAGVTLGLHPDDPPLSPLRGVGRIFSSPDGFRRAMAISSSRAHGITFCQANFVAMGADVARLAREFAPRIVFVHFRDIRGTATNFEECFHDEGPTDMAALLKLYYELGLDVPIRVDHVPSLIGEESLPHGYAYLARLFAVGYLKGILDAYYIPRR